MKKILIAIIVSVMLALFSVLVFWFKPKDNVEMKTHDNTQSTETVGTLEEIEPIQVPQSNKVSKGKFKTGVENLPRSLEGTEVDGEIIIDENKQLVVTEGLRRLFDYFLSTQGEESDEDINQRIEAYITSHTPEPAAGQAIEIYHQYISYLKDLVNIKDSLSSLQMQATENGEFDINLVKARQVEVAKIREKYFSSETIKAFFAEEDSLEEYTLAMIEIQKNTTMSDEQKMQAQKDFISRMPDSEDKKALQEYKAKEANIAELMERTKRMQKQGASAQELYSMRSEMVGEEAAKRLATLDKQEKNFDDRFVQYQLHKQQLEKKYGQDSQKGVQELEKLEKQLFNEMERKRLTGYEAYKKQQ